MDRVQKLGFEIRRAWSWATSSAERTFFSVGEREGVRRGGRRCSVAEAMRKGELGEEKREGRREGEEGVVDEGWDWDDGCRFG